MLVFGEMMDSGSWKSSEGPWTSSWGRMDSGEAWMEELEVRMVGPGDMIGDPCCELEAPVDALMADAGAASGPCAWKAVWTWLGFGR